MFQDIILAGGLCVAVYAFCGYVKYLCRRSLF